MEKRKYNIILESNKKQVIKCGVQDIEFDGVNKFGMLNIPMDDLKKFRNYIKDKNIVFKYANNFSGCFKVYVYDSGKKLDKIKNKHQQRKVDDNIDINNLIESKIDEVVDPNIGYGNDEPESE